MKYNPIIQILAYPSGQVHLLSGKDNHIHPIISNDGKGPECNVGRLCGEGLTQQICVWNDGEMATMESA